MSESNVAPRASWIWPLFGDLALVVIFVVIGRRSHGEANSFAGFVQTLWPFVIGTLVGWGIAAWRKLALRSLAAGGVVLASTVIIGMLLRLASSQGVQWSFILVTTLVLAVFLLGWRLIAMLVRRKAVHA